MPFVEGNQEGVAELDLEFEIMQMEMAQDTLVPWGGRRRSTQPPPPLPEVGLSYQQQYITLIQEMAKDPAIARYPQAIIFLAGQIAFFEELAEGVIVCFA